MPQDLIIFIISDVFVYKCVRASVCVYVYLSLPYTYIYTYHQPAPPNIFLISIHMAVDDLLYEL
jgi:hypothetical protein